MPHIKPSVTYTKITSTAIFHLSLTEFTPSFLVGCMLLIFLVFCVVLLCVFTLWFRVVMSVYDYRIKMMFASVVCRRAHVLFVFACAYSTLCCQFLWIVHYWLPLRVASFSGLSIFDCPFMLPVSLDCPFLIAPSCCQFLWIVQFWLPLRYSLTFIYSFSGLSIFDCLFGIL
jgi:hypothetical protein